MLLSFRVSDFLWEWFKWIVALLVLKLDGVSLDTFLNVVMVALLLLGGVTAADQVKKAVLDWWKKREKFAAAPAASAQGPASQGPASQGPASEKPASQRPSVMARDPKAIPKVVRRNPDYGLSFMPPAEWQIPQPRPPVCLPAEKQCPTCPIYYNGADNLPYSVIAAGLPETEVQVQFKKTSTGAQ